MRGARVASRFRAIPSAETGLEVETGVAGLGLVPNRRPGRAAGVLHESQPETIQTARHHGSDPVQARQDCSLFVAREDDRSIGWPLGAPYTLPGRIPLSNICR